MQDLSNHSLLLEYIEQSRKLSEISVAITRRGIAWQHLAEYGLKFKAMAAYRERYPKCSLNEAREAVESFISTQHGEATQKLSWLELA